MFTASSTVIVTVSSETFVSPILPVIVKVNVSGRLKVKSILSVLSPTHVFSTCNFTVSGVWVLVIVTVRLVLVVFGVIPLLLSEYVTV